MNIPELNIKLTSVKIKGETRNLRTNHFENDIYFLRDKRMQSIINIFNIEKT